MSENCPDYRYPTRYEFCKLGSDLNKTYCVVESEAPQISGPHQDRCKLQPIDKDTQYTYSHNFKINNLFPDCYLNLCHQNPQDKVLDQMINNTTTDENKYFKVRGDSLKEYGYLQDKEQMDRNFAEAKKEDKSLLKYFSS